MQGFSSGYIINLFMRYFSVFMLRNKPQNSLKTSEQNNCIEVYLIKIISIIQSK
jgi:hypothetical protein